MGNIFEYLSNRDLLVASSTSKLWYKTIGNSLEFRKRIVVRIDGGLTRETSNLFKKNIAILKKSNWKYENLHLSYISLNSSFLVADFGKTRQWKNVIIEFSYFEFKDFQKFTASQRSNLQELTINDFQGIEVKQAEDLAMQFPVLKKLILLETANSFLPLLLQSHGCLETIIIHTYASYDFRTKTNLLCFIQLNLTISEISFIGNGIVNIFETDAILKFPIKLKSLEIVCRYKSENIMKNVQRFIKQQEKTLEKLAVTNNPEFGFIYETWNDLQVLKSFRVANLKWVKVSDITPNLRPNKKLLSLEIERTFCEYPFRCLQPFLELLPNVENLLIGSLTKEVFQSVAVNCMNLRTLHYRNTEDRVESLYEKMKLEDNNRVNKNIIIKCDTIRAKTYNELH